MNKTQMIKFLITELQKFTDKKLGLYMNKTECLYALTYDKEKVVHAEKGIDKFICGLQAILNWKKNLGD